MDDIMKIVKSLEELGLLIKGVRETVKSGAKVLPFMLLCTLGATFLGKMLADKPKIPRRGAIRTGKGVI